MRFKSYARVIGELENTVNESLCFREANAECEMWVTRIHNAATFRSCMYIERNENSLFFNSKNDLHYSHEADGGCRIAEYLEETLRENQSCHGSCTVVSSSSEKKQFKSEDGNMFGFRLFKEWRTTIQLFLQILHSS